MSVKSVLKGCHETLGIAANRFRRLEEDRHAYMCELQAEAVLRLLADLDIKQQEETSADD